MAVEYPEVLKCECGANLYFFGGACNDAGDVIEPYYYCPVCQDKAYDDEGNLICVLI
jgi:hypothetical protein